MNEFTKEELNLLEFALSIINLWGSAYGDLKDTDGKKLRSKIQSMIDNYCEHEWRSSAIDAIYCPKCEKHVWWKI